MILKRTLPFLLIFLPALCCAQLRLYFNEYYQPVDSGRPYSYYEEVRQYTNGTVRIKVFDKAGFPISDGSYSSFGQTGKEQKEEGMHRFYRPGQKIPWYQQEFKNGIKEGDLSSWYPTGEVKRIEHFHEGKSIGGECYAQDGSVIPFTPFTKAPEFPGGAQALAAFLEKNLKYPDDAYDYGIEGDLTVDLSVTETGEVKIQQFVTYIDFGIKDEAARIIYKMPKWTPGATDDEVKSGTTRLTIPFRLEKEKRKTPPGSKRFTLIEDVIGTGKRFYINELRERVKPNTPGAMSGTAERISDSLVHIILYDNKDEPIYEADFTHFNRMFEAEKETLPRLKSEEYYKNGIGNLAPEEKLDAQEIQTPPSFQAGETELMRYLVHINYPNAAKENNIMGVVLVSFVVNTDGKIENVRVIKDIGGGCGAEAARVVKAMPQWIAGTANGVPVRVRFTLPIRFWLD